MYNLFMIAHTHIDQNITQKVTERSFEDCGIEQIEILIKITDNRSNMPCAVEILNEELAEIALHAEETD